MNIQNVLCNCSLEFSLTFPELFFLLKQSGFQDLTEKKNFFVFQLNLQPAFAFLSIVRSQFINSTIYTVDPTVLLHSLKSSVTNRTTNLKFFSHFWLVSNVVSPKIIVLPAIMVLPVSRWLLSLFAESLFARHFWVWNSVTVSVRVCWRFIRVLLCGWNSWTNALLWYFGYSK